MTILPGGPDIAPPQVLAGGGADAMLNWMPSALAAREKGLPVVNIAQPFKSSGLMLTCWKDTGIEGPEDFRGKTIGVWFFGNEYPFLSWMSQEGIPTDGGDDGVTILKQGFNVDPLLQRQADCISTMTYNEYGQVLDAGVTEDELVTFKYEDEGVATLEDGIWVLEENLDDPAFVDKMTRFVRASMRGWKYAEENPEEAAGIVLDNDETGRADRGRAGADDGRGGAADRRLRRGARRGRLPADRRHASRRRLGPGDHRGARGGLDERDHGRRAGVGVPGALRNGACGRPRALPLVARRAAVRRRAALAGPDLRAALEQAVSGRGGDLGDTEHVARYVEERARRDRREHDPHDAA